MSASSFINTDLLTTRARRSGVPGMTSAKKFAKKCAAKSTRRTGESTILKEVNLMANPDALRQMSADEMEDFATAFLAHAHDPEQEYCDVDEEDNLLMLTAEDHAAIPANLEGVLPDWMLEQLTAANGNAFDALSLFEAKSATTQAAIHDDEANFA